MTSARPLRVLTSLPSRGKATNPYLLQLLDALERSPEEVVVDLFTWRRALLGRYDAFHVHWPERLVRGASAVGTLAKRMRFAAFLLRLRLAPIAVVRTVHNLTAHEQGDPLERRLLAAFDRRTALWIRLNPFTPVPDGAQVRTIVHGHYRDWFRPVEASPAAGRILFFGLLRAYKGVEELLTAFDEVVDPSASLRLVGSAQDPDLLDRIEHAVHDDPRVSTRIEYVPDADLAAEVAHARLVVLPYRSVHNSGAAILALSLGRPVLMPATATTQWLQREVGEEWLPTYVGELTSADLERALASAPAGPAPRLASRDWAPIAEQHLAAFRAAVAVRRQSRRYSS